MKISLQYNLPFLALTLYHQGHMISFDHVLLDTGSASTIFSVDKAINSGIAYEADDKIHRIRGVGGTEFVFAKVVDKIAVENLKVMSFEVEFGAMDYGYEMDGILGMDFLTEVGAIIDLANLELLPSSQS